MARKLKQIKATSIMSDWPSVSSIAIGDGWARWEIMSHWPVLDGSLLEVRTYVLYRAGSEEAAVAREIKRLNATGGWGRRLDEVSRTTTCPRSSEAANSSRSGLMR